MTKLKLFIFICFCALSTITQAQYTLQFSDVTFFDGEITAYTNTIEKDILIPDNFNGVAVTSIGEGAFQENQLTNVIIPDFVTSIGDAAFQKNKLTQVSIPYYVTSIGNNAFRENDLTEVSIGNFVLSIGNNAFRDNDLTEVSIPYYVTSIGDAAFQKNKLTQVSIGNSVLSIGKEAFRSNQLAEVIIPNSVTSIGEGAFQSNKLTQVIIPNFVLSIGNNAFKDNDLTEVSIGNSVTSIGDAAFQKNKLTQVSIGNSVLSIGKMAFKNNRLTNVIIPNSVTSIGEGAFQDNKLTQVSIGNSVLSIGKEAFKNNRLTNVIIPNSVTSIGNYAFSSNQLTQVSIGNDVTSIGEAAFSSNLLTEVSIPNSVISIGNYVFYNNLLTEVIIPNSVTSIGNYAFHENPGLTSFNLPVHYKGYSYSWSNSKKSGDEITDFGLSYELDEDSKGDAVDFTISYTLDGGTSGGNPISYTVETATITLVEASKVGYTFEGWYSDAAFTADNEVTEIATGSTGPKEFFAKFSDAITYDIAYTLDGGTNAANNPADYTVETATITLAEASKDGYTFEGWYSEAAFTNQVTEIATGSTGPKEFFAKFSETYNITYTLDEGTNAANNPADYIVETATITLADASKDGYTFEGWYSEAAFTNQVTEIATGSTGDVVLFAKYSEIALGIYTTNIKVFNFYPNPSIDFIQTELEVSSLTIRSISGSKVKQFEGGSFFDISNLKSGVYILLAIDKNGDTYKSKLLKE